jgi:hypothetical protein
MTAPVLVVRSLFAYAFVPLLPAASELLAKKKVSDNCSTYVLVCVPSFSLGIFVRQYNRYFPGNPLQLTDAYGLVV